MEAQLVSNDFSGTGDSGSTVCTPMVFQVRTAAIAGVIPTLRTLLADLAMRQDFDLDSVEDLRMAIDEACGLLIPFSSDGQLDCVVTASSAEMIVTVSVLSPNPVLLDADGLGWQLLTALVTAVRQSTIELTEKDHKQGHKLSIEITRHSGVAPR